MADYDDPTLYPMLNPFVMTLMEAPYSSDRYREAIQAADAAGAGCIVTDSGSDEWESEGGVLDLHEKTLQRMAGDDYEKRNRSNMAAWAVAKPPHKKFANSIFRLNAHLILCFRAEEKTTVDKKTNKPVDLGFQPICGKALPYKFRYHLMMHDPMREGGDGTYDVLKAYEHERSVFPAGGRVDHEAAKRLVESFTRRTGASAAAEPEAAKPTWAFASDGSHRLECEGDPDHEDSDRYLFSAMKRHLAGRERWTAREIAIAHQIAKANAELIGGLPEAGRKEIEGLVAALPPKGGTDG